jgi:hypothetical protein
MQRSSFCPAQIRPARDGNAAVVYDQKPSHPSAGLHNAQQNRSERDDRALQTKSRSKTSQFARDIQGISMYAKNVGALS